MIGSRNKGHKVDDGAMDHSTTAPVEDRTRRAGRAARLATVAVALFSLMLVVVLAERFGEDPTLVNSPLIGKPAPSRSLSFLEREGTLALEDLQGQVVVVNFWASWCLACRAEHDDLMQTSAAYSDRGVRFIGVVFQDKRADSIAFLDELGRGYPSLVDPGSRLAIDFGVFGIPETFFIDRQGIVAAKITGESNTTILSSTLEAILAGRQPDSKTSGTVQKPPESQPSTPND